MIMYTEMQKIMMTNRWVVLENVPTTSCYSAEGFGNQIIKEKGVFSLVHTHSWKVWFTTSPSLRPEVAEVNSLEHSTVYNTQSNSVL